MNGSLVHIEGIDGSGKSTVMEACRRFAEARGTRFFDAVDFMKREHSLPRLEDLENATGLLTAEPTFAWIGSSIREEMIAKHEGERAARAYSGAETAEAFALDRLVLFRRLIIPFLTNHPERIVFQDRGLCSSLAYQPLQDPTLTIHRLLTLHGNAQTITFPPSLIILLRTDTAIAMTRLAARYEKRDEHIFEQQDFQTRLAARFFSDEVLDPFRHAGTIIAVVDGNAAQEVVARAIQEILSRSL